MNRFKFIFISFFILSFFQLFAKDIPTGYKQISLGMSLDNVKTELLKDTSFGYHGERDVSLLPNTNRTLIQTDATGPYNFSFLTQCFFQFSNDSLYIITLNMNPDKIDYYSIFTTLCTKYGDPDKVTPQGATWKNETTTMSLEKPLTLKYIDNQTFQNLQNYSNVPKAGKEITKEQFLDEL